MVRWRSGQGTEWLGGWSGGGVVRWRSGQVAEWSGGGVVRWRSVICQVRSDAFVERAPAECGREVSSDLGQRVGDLVLELCDGGFGRTPFSFEQRDQSETARGEGDRPRAGVSPLLATRVAGADENRDILAGSGVSHAELRRELPDRHLADVRKADEGHHVSRRDAGDGMVFVYAAEVVVHLPYELMERSPTALLSGVGSSWIWGRLDLGQRGRVRVVSVSGTARSVTGLI